MAAKTYLDENGLEIVWGKIKEKFLTDVTYNSSTNVLSRTRSGESSQVADLSSLVNQNAFSNIKVGQATVSADSKTDTLELVAGTNVTLTPDTTNDKVTIAAADPTNWKLGQGYIGACSTEKATAAKTISNANYTNIVDGGLVAVRFQNGLCASATLNINSKGAKPIKYGDVDIDANIAEMVQPNDLVLMIYDASNTGSYKIVSIIPYQYNFIRGYATSPEYGLRSISYDEESGIMTVQMNNGNTTWFSSDGQANVIEAIKLNGTQLSPDANKTVAISATANFYSGNLQFANSTSNLATFIGVGRTITSLVDNGTVIAVRFTTTTSSTSQLQIAHGTGQTSLPAYYYNSSGNETALAANRVTKRAYQFIYYNSKWYLLGDLDTDTNTHYTSHLYATTSSGTANAAVTTNGSLYLRLFDDSTARESHKLTGAGGISITSDASGNITFTGTQYSAMSANEATTGTSETSRVISAAVLKAALDNAIAAAQVGAATFKGSVTAYSAITGESYKKGWYWLVGTAGTYAGQACEVGDMIFAVKDKGSSAADGDFTVVQNNLTAGSADPLMDGTKSVGTSAKYAREDHRHPTDTTRAPIASPTFTGTPAAPTAENGSTNTTQIATTAFVHKAISVDVTAITNDTINDICV